MNEGNPVAVEVVEEVDQVQIADDVIAVVAEIAALEVEGLAGTTSGKSDLVQALSSKKKPKGVKVEVADNEVVIEISAVVQYGAKINKVCKEAQEKVKNSVETMTGLHVVSVNINVVGVNFDKQQEA